MSPAVEQLFPPLEVPCPTCTGEAGEKMREEFRADVLAWHEDDQEAYRRFCTSRDGLVLYEDYRNSPEGKAIYSRNPGELPDKGCFECDYKGVVLTEVGRQLRDFMLRWGK